MRPSLFALLATAVLTMPATAAAQTGSQPALVLTVYAGAVTGHSLWRVPKQPICLPDSSGQCGSSPVYDTLAFTRTVGGGLIGGVSVSLFPASAIGVHLEMSYFAPSLENACAPVYVTTQYSQQICTDIAGTSISASTLGLYGGVTARAAPRRALSPYVRGGLGLTFASRSTVGLESAAKAIVIDNEPQHVAASFHAGVGMTAPLGPGYQFRLEIRDILSRQTRLAGPVNSLGQGPSSSKLYHHFALTMGLDVVLERKRGRRY